MGRVKVAVSAELPMREVLVQGLAKLKLPSAHSRSLKHKNTNVDLSMAARYCGIPNNAILDIVADEADAAAGAAMSMVTVALAVPAGVPTAGAARRRLKSDFLSTSTLGAMLRHWDAELALTSRDDDPVLTYIRRRVSPAELNVMTFQQLGVEEGQVMLRLSFAPRDVSSAVSAIVLAAKSEVSHAAEPQPAPASAPASASASAPAAPAAAAAAAAAAPIASTPTLTTSQLLLRGRDFSVLLATMRAAHSTVEASETSQLLLKVIDTVIAQPQNVRIRRIRATNGRIARVIVARAGAVAFLCAAGFELTGDAVAARRLVDRLCDVRTFGGGAAAERPQLLVGDDTVHLEVSAEAAIAPRLLAARRTLAAFALMLTDQGRLGGAATAAPIAAAAAVAPSQPPPSAAAYKARETARFSASSSSSSSSRAAPAVSSMTRTEQMLEQLRLERAQLAGGGTIPERELHVVSVANAVRAVSSSAPSASSSSSSSSSSSASASGGGGSGSRSRSGGVEDERATSRADRMLLARAMQQRPAVAVPKMETKAMRELRRLRNAPVFDRVAIRFILPGRERVVLQANFAPSERARDVAAVLRSALSNGGAALAGDVELYTSPPRVVLDLGSEKTLHDLGFVPAARINVAEVTVATVVSSLGSGIASQRSFAYLSDALREEATALHEGRVDAAAVAAAAKAVPAPLHLASAQQQASSGTSGNASASTSSASAPAAKRARSSGGARGRRSGGGGGGGGGGSKVPAWFKT